MNLGKISNFLKTIEKVRSLRDKGTPAPMQDTVRSSVGRMIAKRHGIMGERISTMITAKRGDPSRPKTGDSKVSVSESSNPSAAAGQMQRATGKAVDEAVSRIERMESSLTEGIQGLETDVVSSLRRMEDHLFDQSRGYSPARSPAPATIDDQSTYSSEPRPTSPPGHGGGILKSVLEGLGEGGGVATAWKYLKGLGGSATSALGGVEVLGPALLALGGYAIGQRMVPDEKTIDERRKRREEIRNSPGVFHQMLSGIGSIFGDSLKTPGVTSQEVRGRSITFKAKKIEFKFDRVSGLVGGSISSPGMGGGDDQEGAGGDSSSGVPDIMTGGGGGGPNESGPSRPSGPTGNPTSKTPVAKQGGPTAPATFSEPFTDPAKRGLVGGKMSAPPIDAKAVQAFFKDRNPGNAKLYGSDNNPLVNPKLLHSSAAGIQKFERDYPNYRVEVYGGSSGLRTSGSIANHGVQGDGEGGAVDYVIVDKRTGKRLTNGPNEQGQGTVGENAPIYQAFANHVIAAGGKLYPDMHLRWGGYFQGGRTPIDLMHIDVRGKTGAMGGGSLETGFTPEQMSRWGIVSNHGMKDYRDTPDGPAATPVTLSKVPGSAIPTNGFVSGAGPQPQGFQAPAPTPVPTPDKPAQQVIVKGFKNDPNTEKDSRVKKKNRFYKGDKQERDQVTFSQYMNVEHDEGIA